MCSCELVSSRYPEVDRICEQVQYYYFSSFPILAHLFILHLKLFCRFIVLVKSDSQHRYSKRRRTLTACLGALRGSVSGSGLIFLVVIFIICILVGQYFY